MDALATDVVAISLAHGADYASTRYAMGRGAYELNPLQQEPASALAIKAAHTVATVYVCDRLRKKGHGRAAKVVRWVTVAAYMGLAAHNVRKSR